MRTFHLVVPNNFEDILKSIGRLCPNFSNTKYIPRRLNFSGIAEPIQVVINTTGRRAGDNKLAFQAVNQTGGLPTGFTVKDGVIRGPNSAGIQVRWTWHHMDDFKPGLNGDPSTCSMQLVETRMHNKLEGIKHSGGGAQYNNYFGIRSYQE